MKIKYILSVVLFCVLTIQSSAQCCGSQEKMIQQITASSFTIYYNQYEGSPYFDKEWRYASLTLLSGETYENLKVRYDLYKGEFIYYNESLKKLLIIDNEIIKDIRLSSQDFTDKVWVTNYCDSSKNACEFYFVYHSDSISLFSKQKKKIEKYNDVSATINYLGRFYTVTKNELLINNTFISVPKGKRALVNLFPANKKEILNFINKSHLNVKDLNDLAVVIAKVNEVEKRQKSVYEEKSNGKFWKKK